jgi:outer membrane protein assembly factor BamE (lipoprotein component of BamABCDE complex)
MPKQIKFIFSLLLCACLSSCVVFHGYSRSFSQGNLIFPEQVAQLHPGMSVQEVLVIMGSPLFVDTFSDNRLNYVYTFKAHDRIVVEKRVVVTVKNGRVSNIEVFIPPVANIPPDQQ